MGSLLRSLVAVLALSVAVVVVGPAPPVMACSCAAITDAEAAEASDAVFVGTLVDVERPPPAESRSSTDPATYTFAVSEVLKGDAAERQEVVSEVWGASCGLELRGDGPFLVFATTTSSGWSPRPGPGQYFAHLCGGTRPLRPGEDLTALRPPPPPPPAPAAPVTAPPTTAAPPPTEPAAPPPTTAATPPPTEPVTPPPTTVEAPAPFEAAEKPSGGKDAAGVEELSMASAAGGVDEEPDGAVVAAATTLAAGVGIAVAAVAVRRRSVT